MALFSLFNKKSSLLASGILENSTDRHSHILYGVDDGVGTLAESLEILDYLQELGVKELWCTPHVMEDIPNTTQFLRERFTQLQQEYKGNIKLNLAAEYMLDTLFEARLKSSDLLTMEDDTLLVETSTVAEPYNFYGVLQDIMSAGYRPLYAHPERYRFLGEKDFDKLYKMGVKFQLNLGSISGFYGQTAQKKAEYILSKGMYWCTGSDCHKLSSIKHQHNRDEITNKILKYFQSGIFK